MSFFAAICDKRPGCQGSNLRKNYRAKKDMERGTEKITRTTIFNGNKKGNESMLKSQKGQRVIVDQEEGKVNRYRQIKGSLNRYRNSEEPVVPQRIIKSHKVSIN